VSDDPVARVTAAVNECLERCRTCGLPSVELIAYLSGLKGQGWKDSEVEVVKVAVLRAIGEEHWKRRE